MESYPDDITLVLEDEHASSDATRDSLLQIPTTQFSTTIRELN